MGAVVPVVMEFDSPWLHRYVNRFGVVVQREDMRLAVSERGFDSRRLHHDRKSRLQGRGSLTRAGSSKKEDTRRNMRDTYLRVV